MNKAAGDLSFLGLGSTHFVLCLSCCCHLKCVFLYHMWLLLLFSCIRMWNRSVLWSRRGPFLCLAIEWHLFFWFFFLFFYSLQLRAHYNYFHQGPWTLSGGEKKEQNTVTAPVRKCVCSSISISASLQGAALVSKAQRKCSWIFKTPLTWRRWIIFWSKKSSIKGEPLFIYLFFTFIFITRFHIIIRRKKMKGLKHIYLMHPIMTIRETLCFTIF